MKKNHPNRRPQSLRKSTVRPERIFSDRSQRRSNIPVSNEIEFHEKCDDQSKLRVKIILLIAAIVLLLIIIPLSCRLLPDGDTNDTKMSSDMTDSNLSENDNEGLSSSTAVSEATMNEISDTDSTSEHEQSTKTTEVQKATEIQETTHTDKNVSDTIDYPQANQNLLPVMSNYSDDEIEAIPSVIYAWSFIRPAQRHEDLPAKISQQAEEIIEPYAVIWQLPQTDKPTVYLTMDEGYEYANNTTRILDIALEKEVGISFFITGDFIDRNPDLVLRMTEEGHQVANHSVNHPSLPKLLQEEGREAMMAELLELEQTYEQLTGSSMTRLIRPPMGEFSPRMIAILNDEGFIPAFWSFAYVDWYVNNQPAPSAALDQIIGELHDGSVILLHASSKTNVDILPELIDSIRKRGYNIALLPEP